MNHNDIEKQLLETVEKMSKVTDAISKRKQRLDVQERQIPEFVEITVHNNDRDAQILKHTTTGYGFVSEQAASPYTTKLTFTKGANR